MAATMSKPWRAASSARSVAWAGYSVGAQSTLPYCVITDCSEEAMSQARPRSACALKISLMRVILRPPRCLVLRRGCGAAQSQRLIRLDHKRAVRKSLLDLGFVPGFAAEGLLSGQVIRRDA